MARPSRHIASRPRRSSPGRAFQPEQITSSDNSWLKRFRSALGGKNERGDAAIGIEGVRLVEEAIRSAIPVEAILVSQSGRKHLERIAGRLNDGARVLATTDPIFDALAGTETPQGIAALVRPQRASFDDLVAGPGEPLIAVLVGVQDPGNVGTIVRAAEALGASGVATCGSDSLQTARVFAPKTVRASAGAAFRLPIAEGLSPAILQTQLRMAGVRALAATSNESAQDAIAPWEADFRGPAAIFIGNEGAGLPAAIERQADDRIRIPLHTVNGESVESLNAASAASILLYEAARQRAEAKREPSA
jgi:RNA methyltransferase, TrmH family